MRYHMKSNIVCLFRKKNRKRSDNRTNHYSSSPIIQGRDRMVVGFTTTYAFCAYHY